MSYRKIAIIGPGVVGKATGIAFLAKGADVTFVGIDPEQTKKLRREGYKAYLNTELVNGSFDFDISFLTVPTPTKAGRIDLSYLTLATTELAKRLRTLRKYHLVVVKSTVPPGTTQNLVLPLLEKKSGKKAGRDFGLCMNPEYLREDTAIDDSLHPWLITIGELDKKSGEILHLLYTHFDCPVVYVSLTEAELEKYIHNLFNATKISFFNEMRQITTQVGANADKVFRLVAISAEGMWNPKYGIKDLGPFAGSCLPKDTQAFYSWAKDLKFDPILLKATIAVNEYLTRKAHASAYTT